MAISCKESLSLPQLLLAASGLAINLLLVSVPGGQLFLISRALCL